MITFASENKLKEIPEAKNELKMNVDNAKSQMRKGMLEYCVLLLLRGERSYANDIIQKLKDADLIVVEGTLYPLLTRLKKDGLLSYEWQESLQGPPRKYYALTDEGLNWLAGLNAAWNELANTVALLKNNIATETQDNKNNEEK
jgi:PadR family transcriptional regulator PadR